MRKLSHSAKASVQSTGQRLRRKTSSSGQSRREHSTGPITRKRSDSKTVSSNGASTGDLIASDFEDSRYLDSLGISGINDASSIASEPFSPTNSSPEGTAAALPDQLIGGSTLIKVTKRKRQTLQFLLSVDGSMVSWNPAKSSKRFFIDDIRGIRYGEDAANYQQDHQAEWYEVDRWFTVLYADPDRSKQTKTIHLIAPSKDDMSLWISTLEALSKHREDLMTGMTGYIERENVIRAHWDREMLKRSSRDPVTSDGNALNLHAVEALCRSLHIHCSKTTIQEQFRLADSRSTGLLNYNEFKDFVRRLKERKDLLPIFKALTQGNGYGLTRVNFLSFLENVQCVNLTSDNYDHVFQNLVDSTRSRRSSHQSIVPHETETIDFEAFASFLVSEVCNIYQSSTPRAVFDRPLNQYFISSSHNTYLLGWQLGGNSSTEAYITALRHGCRCVELDCWNGPDGRPIVTHGHTRTTPVLFVDCISVISRYAFEASEYPVILSLEVHCDAEQQAKMVQILKDGLGERLVLQPLADNSIELPTPEELKLKILVKVKTSEHSIETGLFSDQGDISRRRSASSPYVRPALSETPVFANLPPLSNPPTVNPPVYEPRAINSPNQRSMTVTSASSAGEESDGPSGRNVLSTTPKKKKPTSKIVKPLADLGVYLQGYKYRGFITVEGREFNHIFSLDETKAGNLCRNPQEKAQFEDHNVRFLFRVYPKGFRFDSSNFDPNTFWRRGVQMVALNWQTYDQYMQMNQAMFAAGTDRYGYVIKPDYLRQPRITDGDVNSRLKLPRRLVRFSVEMISAQQLPRLHSMDREGTINPFIEIQLFNAEDKARGIASGSGGEDSSRNGYSGIGSPYGRRTKVVIDNGYNPQFNDRFELSLETKYPELVFVRWIVWNSPNGRYTGNNCTQLAVFTAKLSSLQQGYRHLPLYNGNGEEFVFSTLFCKIKKEDPVLIPSSQEELRDLNGRATSRGLIRGLLTRTLSSDRGGDKPPSPEEQKKKMLREIRDRAALK